MNRGKFAFEATMFARFGILPVCGMPGPSMLNKRNEALKDYEPAHFSQKELSFHAGELDGCVVQIRTTTSREVGEIVQQCNQRGGLWLSQFRAQASLRFRSFDSTIRLYRALVFPTFELVLCMAVQVWPGILGRSWKNQDQRDLYDPP